MKVIRLSFHVSHQKDDLLIMTYYMWSADFSFCREGNMTWFFVMTVVLFGIDASILWRDFVTISENRIYSSSCRMFSIRLDFLDVRSLLYEYILWMKITMNFRVGISSTTLLLFYVFFFFRCAIRRLLYDFPSERACLCFDRNAFHLMSSSLFLRPLQDGEL